MNGGIEVVLHPKSLSFRTRPRMFYELHKKIGVLIILIIINGASGRVGTLKSALDGER